MAIAEMRFDNEKLLVLGWFVRNFGSPIIKNLADKELFVFNVGESDYYTVEFIRYLFSISFIRIKNINSFIGNLVIPEHIEQLATFRSLS